MRLLPAPSAGLAVVAASGGSFDPQGPAARDISALWWLLFWLGLAVFVVFAVLLVAALLRRRRGDAEASDADGSRTGRWWLVGGGVAMPAVVLVIVLVVTVETMVDLEGLGGDDALQVEITGHQWWWEVSYPDHDVTTANEIHMPVGRPVEFSLTSADVIHSFWVPQLGGKLDLLPEDLNTLTLQADEPATYRSQCAEFCGLQHANMRFIVVAEPAEQFEAWLAAQAQPASEPTSQAAQAGREVFLDGQCVKCHAIAGVNADPNEPGPDLTHFAGRSAVTAALLPDTRMQLRDWLANPQHYKDGTSMPPADLPDDELEALVTYLESLQ